MSSSSAPRLTVRQSALYRLPEPSISNVPRCRCSSVEISPVTASTIRILLLRIPMNRFPAVSNAI